MKDEFTDAIYSLSWKAVRAMPGPLARTTFKVLADQAWLLHGPSVQQLEKNLRRVVPTASTRQLRELSRAAMRSYARYWNEVFRLPDLTHEQIVNTLRPEGAQHLAAALERGKGVVLALPHMGNWDHGGAWVMLEFGHVTTVVERLKPEGIYQQFLEFRRAMGMEILPLTGGESPFRVLLERCKQGRLVVLVGDRDLSGQGVPVDFFGEPTTMPGGPAALAVAAGAALLPVTIWFDDRNTCLRINPPLEVPEGLTRTEKIAHLTQQMADTFAAGIAEHPADWHMLQPLWPADLATNRNSGGSR